MPFPRRPYHRNRKTPIAENSSFFFFKFLFFSPHPALFPQSPFPPLLTFSDSGSSIRRFFREGETLRRGYFPSLRDVHALFVNFSVVGKSLPYVMVPFPAFFFLLPPLGLLYSLPSSFPCRPFLLAPFRRSRGDSWLHIPLYRERSVFSYVPPKFQLLSLPDSM